jgi:hypothetical protein
LTSVAPKEYLALLHSDSYPVQEKLKPNTSIALIPRLIGDNLLKSIGVGCIISPNLSLIASGKILG